MSVAFEETVRSGLLVLHARTPLHPGTGTALGLVDLPVQRERFTGWPMIAGSAIKGVLRDACRRRSGAQPGQDAELTAVFGPDRPQESRLHAGAVSVTDARVLAFPVRSLRGVFAWVTCPTALERLSQDISWSGLQLNPPPLEREPDRNQALAASGDVVVSGGGVDSVVLEEFEFQRVGTCDALGRWFAQHIATDQLSSQRMASHLVILHDDDFSHFVQYSTEITARIRLEADSKTASEGGLFYEEFLPAETVLYSVLIANRTRDKAAQQWGASQVLGYLKEKLPPVLQVGGDETVGKGFCTVRLIS